mmetsp:Transcript_19656/g.37504  ORF Transcript_19656/g.37504 Transcript_19656/m.37504 type:complete len:202 (+) Transcript_19656:890-1495(+)
MSVMEGCVTNTGCEWYHPTTCRFKAWMASTTVNWSAGSISACTLLSVQSSWRTGKARCTVSLRVWGSHAPPRKPMISWWQRWACRSITRHEARSTSTSNGCKPLAAASVVDALAPPSRSAVLARAYSWHGTILRVRPASSSSSSVGSSEGSAVCSWGGRRCTVRRSRCGRDRAYSVRLGGPASASGSKSARVDLGFLGLGL